MKRIFCLLLCLLTALGPSCAWAEINPDNLPIGSLNGYRSGGDWFGENFH